MYRLGTLPPPSLSSLFPLGSGEERHRLNITSLSSAKRRYRLGHLPRLGKGRYRSGEREIKRLNVLLAKMMVDGSVVRARTERLDMVYR
jgi:hypothetical protein